MKMFLLTAAATGLLAIAAPANAGERDAAVAVSHADLDLGREAGARIMMRRLKGAANAVCGDVPARAPLQARRAYRECMRGALARAVERLGSPTVTTLYQRQRGARFA